MSLSKPTRSQARTWIVDGIGLAGLGAPGDLDQPLGIGQVDQVRAVGAVDGDPAPAGHVADDRVAVDRLAAGREDVSRSPTPITSSRSGARGFGT